ncbi:MAG: hypothetical protein ACO3K7_05465 [Candidatus Marinamargulisbacteria bacterium]
MSVEDMLNVGKNRSMITLRSQFKGAHVIFLVVHYNFECVRLTLLNILSIIESMDNTYLVLINSAASKKITNYAHAIQSDKVDIVHLPINFGYNHSVNYYIRDFISAENLPKTIISLGADILFLKDHLMQLIDAIAHLPRYGTLSLSYENNACNPERNALKPRLVKGNNGREYYIRHTFFCPVPGGIMGLRGDILNHDLNYELFNPKFFPRRFLGVNPVGGADASLYNALKHKYKVGYLAHTSALHMKSRTGDVLDIPQKWQLYIDKLQGLESQLIK